MPYELRFYFEQCAVERNGAVFLHFAFLLEEKQVADVPGFDLSLEAMTPARYKDRKRPARGASTILD